MMLTGNSSLATAIDAVKAYVLDQSEIDDAKKMLPDAVFKELYLAEPSDDQGNPFGLKAIAACVKPMSIDSPTVCRGIDFAKSVDWTVDIGLDQFGRMTSFSRYQIGWEAQIPILKKSIGRTPTLADSTGVGDVVVERLQKECGQNIVEGYVFSSKSKQILMEGLVLAIQAGEVSFPDAPDGVLPSDHPGNVRRELELFEYEYSRTGVRYTAPEGFHDDCVMSLALAVMHRTHARLPMKINKAVIAKAAGMRR